MPYARTVRLDKYVSSIFEELNWAFSSAAPPLLCSSYYVVRLSRCPCSLRVCTHAPACPDLLPKSSPSIQCIDSWWLAVRNGVQNRQVQMVT